MNTISFIIYQPYPSNLGERNSENYPKGDSYLFRNRPKLNGHFGAFKGLISSILISWSGVTFRLVGQNV